MFRPVWILPRRWTSKVRSVTSTTFAPRTACTVEMTWPRCSVLVHSTVTSRSVMSPLASTVSTATICPPSRLIAAVTLPSVPPWRGTSTRMVSENWAEGVATGAKATAGGAPLGGYATLLVRRGHRRLPGGARLPAAQVEQDADDDDPDQREQGGEETRRRELEDEQDDAYPSEPGRQHCAADRRERPTQDEHRRRPGESDPRVIVQGVWALGRRWPDLVREVG